MLKTALVAMTIVGCDCDAKLCEFVSESPAQYASISECEAAVHAEAIRTPGQDYPLVTGICRTVHAEPAEAPATALASLEQTDGSRLYELARESGGFMRDTAVRGYTLVRDGMSWTTEKVRPTVISLAQTVVQP